MHAYSLSLWSIGRRCGRRWSLDAEVAVHPVGSLGSRGLEHPLSRWDLEIRGPQKRGPQGRIARLRGSDPIAGEMVDRLTFSTLEPINITPGPHRSESVPVLACSFGHSILERVLNDEQARTSESGFLHIVFASLSVVQPFGRCASLVLLSPPDTYGPSSMFTGPASYSCIANSLLAPPVMPRANCNQGYRHGHHLEAHTYRSCDMFSFRASNLPRCRE